MTQTPKIKATSEQVKFLKKNHSRLTTLQLTDGLGVSSTVLRRWCKEMGIVKKLVVGVAAESKYFVHDKNVI